MRIKIVENAPIAVFLFAHQDDEFGVFHQITLERTSGVRVFCIYLTSGVSYGGCSRRRNSESLQVLRDLGVSEDHVVFAGEKLGISDGGVLEALDIARRWFGDWLDACGEVARIYIPAWEGGHPDHDALHALALKVATVSSPNARISQFSLYNAVGCRRPFFRVLNPIEANGVVQSARIPWRRRFLYLRMCLSYSSQRKSWFGLFPFVLTHYLLSGRQQLQPVSVGRVKCRPHAGMLYYEMRSFATWNRVSAQVSRLFL